MTTAFLLFFGIGLLIVSYRGYRDGAMRAGPRGTRPLAPTRDENPFVFHVVIVFFFFGGLALLTWGLLALVGIAEPLPLRS